jgi:hypothetical protein
MGYLREVLEIQMRGGLSGGQSIQGNIRKLKKQSKKVTWGKQGKHGKMLGRDRRGILFQRGAKGSSVLVRQGFRHYIITFGKWDRRREKGEEESPKRLKGLPSLKSQI